MALVVINAAALPFWLDSGAAWLRVSYLENFVYKLQWTTAMSFNVWYADLLTTGVLDPRVPILGLARDAWGTLLLATGVAAAYGTGAPLGAPQSGARTISPCCRSRHMVMLAAILLPTRVHSTYGAFTAPFLIATAFLIPRTAIAAAACLVTMSLADPLLAVGNLLAMHVQPDESVFPPAVRAHRRGAPRAIDRPREWALTIANLAAAAAVAAGVAQLRGRTSASRPAS